MAASTKALEELSDAQLQVDQARKAIGEARGCCGGWQNESRYQAAHSRYYNALAGAGVEVTRRKRNGTYYILGSD